MNRRDQTVDLEEFGRFGEPALRDNDAHFKA
jgi:hypothetical protein